MNPLSQEYLNYQFGELRIGAWYYFCYGFHRKLAYVQNIHTNTLTGEMAISFDILDWVYEKDGNLRIDAKTFFHINIDGFFPVFAGCGKPTFIRKFVRKIMRIGGKLYTKPPLILPDVLKDLGWDVRLRVIVANSLNERTKE